MAPEIVQEHPYNHTTDLWSLGVILFELFAGQPPFYTNNIITLMAHIVKDQVKYPPTMSAPFKSFLAGLLNKHPDKRLNWPALAEHPFVRGGYQPPGVAPSAVPPVPKATPSRPTTAVTPAVPSSRPTTAAAAPPSSVTAATPALHRVDSAPAQPQTQQPQPQQHRPTTATRGGGGGDQARPVTATPTAPVERIAAAVVVDTIPRSATVFPGSSAVFASSLPFPVAEGATVLDQSDIQLRSQLAERLAKEGFVASFTQRLSSADTAARLDCAKVVLACALSSRSFCDAAADRSLLAALVSCLSFDLATLSAVVLLSLALIVRNTEPAASRLMESGVMRPDVLHRLAMAKTSAPAVSSFAMLLIVQLVNREMAAAASLLSDSTILSTAVQSLLTDPKSIAGLGVNIEGWRRCGLLDGPVALICTVVDTKPAAVADALGGDGVHEQLLLQFRPASSMHELSPAGLRYASHAVYMIMLRASRHLTILKEPSMCAALVAVLQPQQLQAVERWPVICGGGPSVVRGLLKEVLSILYLPFTASAVDVKALAEIQQNMEKHGVIKCVIQAALQVKQELNLAMGLLTRLVLGSAESATQFATCGGMQFSVDILASPASKSSLLLDALLALGQLARASSGYYEGMHRANILGRLVTLISHEDANVRAKVCNLVGNLCRHSEYFYDGLHRSGLLAQLIAKCADSDSTTRKFACFAVGNAAYHNDSLYAPLRAGCPIVVRLLNDDADEKTRANAAGALGNLVRNGSALYNELANAGALDALCKCVQNDSVATGRIALFSLGNFAAYPDCRSHLQQNGFVEQARRLRASPDLTMRKYAVRVLSKCGLS
eukprot:TRINITY_DN8077_c0_g1_i1.p1 TRINITY_DN8077_c0_g1~~TRINITY_DN8077_c0_g1_i1.p1  ORF type:complete len:836 (+),score=186.91 TRINITY_DN8077_c0_g1_i1:486-2993(+)